MSQEHLARLTGLTRSSIANIETDRQRPPLDDIYRIAVALKRPVSALLPDSTELIPQSRRIRINGVEEEVPLSAAAFIEGLRAKGTLRS